MGRYLKKIDANGQTCFERQQSYQKAFKITII